MKHEKSTTALLVLMFLLSQIIGLILVNGSISSVQKEDGEVIIEHKTTPVGRIELSGAQSLIFVIISVALGTVLILILIRFRLVVVWRFWFFVAAFVTTTISLSVFLDKLIASAFAFLLVILNVVRGNPLTQNFMEMLVFSGIAILFVPIFNIFWITIFLLIISVYDMIAVRKTKHMISMALFLDRSKAFAGFSIPAKNRGKPHKVTTGEIPKKIPHKSGGTENAVLGGGDIAFSLLFSGVVLERLISMGFERLFSLLLSFVVVLFITSALLLLLLISKKGRFYPAMPFISAGAVLGYVFVLFITGFA